MRTACSFWLVVGLVACGSPGAVLTDAGSDGNIAADGGVVPEDSSVVDAGRADAAPPADAASDAGPPPSDALLAMYEGVLLPHCGGGACHAPGTNESSYFGYAPALQMPDARTARAVLVDRHVECMSSTDDRIRVVPGDPAASAIMTVAEDGLCGRRHNLVVPRLTPEDLAIIEAWIAAGAP